MNKDSEILRALADLIKDIPAFSSGLSVNHLRRIADQLQHQEVSEEEIKEIATHKSNYSGYTGTSCAAYWAGIIQGAKWMQSKLKLGNK